MVRPEILSIDQSLLPEGSAATTAATALMGDGALKLIELFKSESRGELSVEFRGLPANADLIVHAAQAFYYAVQESNADALVPTYYQPGAYEERENRILLEYAIGARQDLWKGAKPVYDSEADDPRSPHYNFGN